MTATPDSPLFDSTSTPGLGGSPGLPVPLPPPTARRTADSRDLSDKPASEVEREVENRRESQSPTAYPSTSIDVDSRTGLDDASSMLKKDIPNVLPLHLAPIDSFFLADDKPQYPMTSVIRMAFQGRIVPEAFHHALEEATRRHPLTGAVIRKAKQGRPCWVHDGSIKPWTNWGPIDQPIEYPEQEGFDLSQECGLRFWLRNDDHRTVITVQVHHACTDGTGVYRFLGDLLAIYGQQTAAVGDKQPELSEIDPRLLRQRRSRLIETGEPTSTWDRVAKSLSQTYRIFGKRITPLAAPETRDRGSVLTPFPGVVSFQFDQDDHKQLRKFAGSHGAMLNDLLMAEMFRTILQWNRDHGTSRPNGWLRVMMPSDLRDQRDFLMPATNMTAYTFITRRAETCGDFADLMTGIRAETCRIKHGNLGRSFMNTVDVAQRAAPVMNYLLGQNRCIATTILSNVGDPSKRFTASFPRVKGQVVCGNLVLEDVSGVPPMRIQSHATLAIFSYLRKLTISVRCNPYRFRIADSRAFLDVFVKNIRRHLPPPADQ